MANYLLISGSSTIGCVAAKSLIDKGHNIIITGRNEEKIANIANELGVKYKVLDASNFDDVDRVFANVKEHFGEINGIVNFSGSLLIKPAHLTSRQNFDSVISDNLTTAFAVVRACGNHMNITGGSVVLISSAVAMVGVVNHEAIAAAKAGIIGLAMSAAASYSNNNLRFNVVAPGLTDTNLTKSIISNTDSLKFSKAMHALGRIGKPEDIASAIVFFLSPENDWITGQVLAVDGGLSNVRPKLKI